MAAQIPVEGHHLEARQGPAEAVSHLATHDVALLGRDVQLGTQAGVVYGLRFADHDTLVVDGVHDQLRAPALAGGGAKVCVLERDAVVSVGIGSRFAKDSRTPEVEVVCDHADARYRCIIDSFVDGAEYFVGLARRQGTQFLEAFIESVGGAWIDDAIHLRVQALLPLKGERQRTGHLVKELG
ncbi:hypothetical protein [Accumulibacter sp.]|uniref:hypothetical protein n=1 Tax=Accumulibacter sp. TaxID=2053492 RepID=UPI0028C433AE|nr:hypothetical protein [Accumulibacter sp.]